MNSNIKVNNLSFIKANYPDYNVQINYGTPTLQEGPNKIMEAICIVGTVYDGSIVAQVFHITDTSNYSIDVTISLLKGQVEQAISNLKNSRDSKES